MADKTLYFPSPKPLWYQIGGHAATDRGIKRKITSYPRRHGKDFEDLSLAAKECVMRRGTYYYVFPTRRWGERAIWETMATIGDQSKPIIDWIFPDEICKKFKSDLRIEVQGRHGVSKFFMGGTDNLDFVGQGGQGYTMSEFSLHKEEVTSLLAPIIRQSQAYLRLNGTMRGKRNPLYQILQNTLTDPEWFSTWLTPEDTKLYCWVGDEMNINPELVPLIGAIDPKTGELFKNVQNVPYYNIQSDIDSGMISHAYARQEYLNRADSEVAGGYYGYELKALNARNGIFPIDPFSDLVYTFWDVGGPNKENDHTAILFAHVNTSNNTARVVDYYENTGHLRGHYLEVIENKRYNYGGHYMPHDAKQSNAWTGEDSAETARNEYGVEIRFIPKSQKTANDIEITRRGFANTSFDDNRCDDLLMHLGCYHEKDVTGKPCHNNKCNICNGASHGADTFRYLQMAIHLNLVEPYLQTQPKRFSWNDERELDYIEDDGFLV